VLYGFATEDERRLFRSLINGVGRGAQDRARAAVGHQRQRLARCVLDEDIGTLTRVPGVGRKTAERLIVENARSPGAAPGDSWRSAGGERERHGGAYGALVAARLPSRGGGALAQSGSVPVHIRLRN